MCLTSELRPKEGSDKGESPLEARNNGGVSAAWGRLHAPNKRVHVRLVKKHGDHVTGWLHHPDHPLTQQCCVGVLKVAYAKATICNETTYRAPGKESAPPSGIYLAPEKAPHGPLKSASYPCQHSKDQHKIGRALAANLVFRVTCPPTADPGTEQGAPQLVSLSVWHTSTPTLWKARSPRR